MCGIAGLIDLEQQRNMDPEMLRRMAAAIEHRGPDELGYFRAPGVGLANRRLSIVGIADGQQPIFNEDRSVVVVFNGELFNFVEQRRELQRRGHRFSTATDTELLVHLWEEHGLEMLPLLRGQFAFCLYDVVNRQVVLARDRVGITPLQYARSGGTLLFASEVKALFASGIVQRQADIRGIDHLFTTMSLGTRRTAFEQISSLPPAGYLNIELGRDGEAARISEGTYWDLDFPDAGEEERGAEIGALREQFDELFQRAVRIRLRCDVPVVGYLSGGVDSTTVMSVASQLSPQPLPAFTIDIPSGNLSELARARHAADRIGSPLHVTTCDSETIARAFPSLIQAAESPVIDTSSAALYCNAAAVRDAGYKVALTGEGADEWLAGYPWLKAHKLISRLDWKRMRTSQMFRRGLLGLSRFRTPWSEINHLFQTAGGLNGLTDLHAVLAFSRELFYSPEMRRELRGFSPYTDIEMDLAKAARWHPLNRALYLGSKTMLPGLLMTHKGDRPAMHNSVETRYPFLDESIVDFCAKLPPEMKLNGFRRDKHLLRTYAADFLPAEIADRPKAMFRAPFANLFFGSELGGKLRFIDQLLSPESLAATGYFDVQKVLECRANYQQIRVRRLERLITEIGLTGVLATQLWHHTFLGGGLCELPEWSPPATAPVKVGTAPLGIAVR